MNEYREQEIKVLDINVKQLVEGLEKIGAKKVYDDMRTIIALDTKNHSFLNEEDKLIRITEEGSIKVTMHINQSHLETKEEIKFKTSRLKETIDFFHQMGLDPMSKVQASRISFELGKIDFDIDCFSAISPFLEIDIKHLKEEGDTIESLLEMLGLEKNKVVIMGTEDIHKLYGIDYSEAYKA